MTGLALGLLVIHLGVSNPVMIEWPPSPDPVTQYEIEVVALSELEAVLIRAFVLEPIEALALPLWQPLRLRVRGHNATGPGKWSAPLDVVLNPHPADLDYDGSVGLSDFGALVLGIGADRTDPDGCDTTGDGVVDGSCD